MITLDAVRAAILADKPWTRLDELVRAELAAGRLTRQVFDDLHSLEDALRATPGFGDDAEEALGDTLDRLSGFCRQEFAYKNPPVLPSEEEITKLPRWARVAFAARCARRVLPLYGSFRPGSSEPIEKLNPAWAVNEAEQSAADATAGPRTASGYDAAAAGYYAADDPHDEAAYSAANAAAYAVADASDDQRSVRAFVAMNHAAHAAKSLADLRLHIRRDFDHLARLAEWQHWTDDTPVPPEVFGPLWPEGPPPGWPADPDIPHRTDLPLEILSRARDLGQMTEDEAVNVFNAINAYYIARTGTRLTMEGLRPLIAAAVPAEV
jgi:hypothetical protein